MRIRPRFWIALVAASLLGSAGGASAAVFDYTATLDIDISTIAPFSIESSGQISVNPDGSFVLPAGIFATTRTLIPPQTPSEAVASVEFQVSNASGSFNGPGNPGGSMSLNGQAILNLQAFLGFSPVVVGLSPLGSTGTATGMASNGSVTVTATITGSPWQTGVFPQVGITSSGSTFAPRTNTGEDLRTMGGEGVVTYVVPAYVTTRLGGAFSEQSPISGVLTITFTPEPGQLVAEAAAIGALLLIGVQRRARRRR